MCGGNLSGLIPINPSLEFYFSQEKYIQCGLFSERCGKPSSKNLICVFFHFFYQKDFGLLFMKIKTFIMYQSDLMSDCLQHGVGFVQLQRNRTGKHFKYEPKNS